MPALAPLHSGRSSRDSNGVDIDIAGEQSPTAELLIIRTVSWLPRSDTSAGTTLAPSRAKARAVVRPIPLPAPVTNATLSAKPPAHSLQSSPFLSSLLRLEVGDLARADLPALSGPISCCPSRGRGHGNAPSYVISSPMREHMDRPDREGSLVSTPFIRISHAGCKPGLLDMVDGVVAGRGLGRPALTAPLINCQSEERS